MGKMSINRLYKMCRWMHYLMPEKTYRKGKDNIKQLHSSLTISVYFNQNEISKFKPNKNWRIHCYYFDVFPLAFVNVAFFVIHKRGKKN